MIDRKSTTTKKRNEGLHKYTQDIYNLK